MKKIGLILDTNCFLHFRGVDQISWNHLLGEGIVYLLVIDPLSKELDRQKWNKVGKLRERAEKTIKNFFTWFDQGNDFSFSENLHISLVELYKPDFDDLHLSKDELDDWFIAYALNIQESKKYDDLFVLSNDFGMHQKARQRNLKSIRLSDDYRLPSPQSDLEKENDMLKNEMLKLKNRLPKLKITFDGGNDYISLEVSEVELLPEEELKELLSKLHDEYPYALKGKSESTIVFKENGERTKSNLDDIAKTVTTLAYFTAPSKEQLEQYDESLDNFFHSKLNYEFQKRQIEAMRARSIRFKLGIDNVGTAMATNIQVSLHFPVSKTCKFMTVEEFEKLMPDEPLPPEYPESKFTFGQSFQGGRDIYIPSFHRPEVLPAPNVSSPRFTTTSSFDINFTIGDLVQHTGDSTEEMILIFPSVEEAKSFMATYSIICPEIPVPTTGKLHLEISK
jgi:archaellum component FlaC